MPPVLVVLHAGDLPDGLQSVAEAAEVRYATVDTLADAVDGADALLLWDFFSAAVRSAWPRCTSLKWIHIAAAGVDSLLFEGLVESDVIVTNSRGVFDRPIAEFVLAQILAFAKDSERSRALQHSKTWEHRETERIDGAHAMVVGTGAIGRAIAQLLTAVGMSVSGVGRTARDGDCDFGSVYASSELAAVVSRADYLILIAPLTRHTRGMVGDTVLARMKAGSRIVNVGRGELVDTQALLNHLGTGHLAGAALDVFESEPLPADHPLWTTENVVITPHMSGDVSGWKQRLAQLFVDNAHRYLQGRPLLNVVDKKLGFVPS